MRSELDAIDGYEYGDIRVSGGLVNPAPPHHRVDASRHVKNEESKSANVQTCILDNHKYAKLLAIY